MKEHQSNWSVRRLETQLLPSPGISWTKRRWDAKDQSFDDDTLLVIQITGTGQLLTLTLTHSTAGSYYCSAHSAMFPSSVISRTARLTISRGPTITSAQVTWQRAGELRVKLWVWQDQVAQIMGSQAMVRCKADTSALEATVTWSFHGKKITPGLGIQADIG